MKFKIEYECRTDILVIGAGGAGIKAAIKASESGAGVLLVSKSAFGRTGATFYPGTPGWGVNAVIFEGDTPEFYYDEILEAGAGAADVKLARILANECTACFRELEEYGLEFPIDPQTGVYNGVIPCFGKRKRGSTTYGIGRIRDILWLQLKRKNVEVRTCISIISLVIDHGNCIGAVGLDEFSNLVFFKAKAIILATGGGSGLFKYSLATPDQTGDGYALALDAGAKLVNLEFIQFELGLTWPVKKLLFQEKNLDTFPSITNKNGEDVLGKYLPINIAKKECLIERAKHGPFSTATVSRYMDIAIYEECKTGLALESGGIHLQYSPEVLKDVRWPIKAWVQWMRERNVDPVKYGFDIIPHAQCFNGGIYIDENANTGIPGLFAAGETAGGPHGADRLGGAAMAATQVFGARAGVAAAQYASSKHHSQMSLRDAEEAVISRFMKKGGGIIDISAAKANIKDILWQCAAIVRSQERCKQGLMEIEALEASFNPLAHFYANIQTRNVNELYSYILIAKSLLSIISFRKESRGPHYRVDYPECSDSLRGMVELFKKDDALFLNFKKAEY